MTEQEADIERTKGAMIICEHLVEILNQNKGLMMHGEALQTKNNIVLRIQKEIAGLIANNGEQCDECKSFDIEIRNNEENKCRRCEPEKKNESI